MASRTVALVAATTLALGLVSTMSAATAAETVQVGKPKNKNTTKAKKRRAQKATGYYAMPFPCGEMWTGTTRSNHSPNSNSIDWNRPDDVDDPVVASAPGTVTVANSTSKRGYGHYVQITHANGEVTTYAHMNAVTVSQGQFVDQGAQVGTVGATGNATGPHLHYEQRVKGIVARAVFGGLSFKYGSTMASDNCVDVPLAGNFGGSAAYEAGFFRRNGRFYLRQPDGSERVIAFGRGTDLPAIGDWNGDGLSDLAVFRPDNSVWYLNTAGVVSEVQFGVRGDRPVAGDWDGDGLDQVGVYRPSTRSFYLRNAAGTGWDTITFGTGTETPVSGDWNGDGIDDVGLFNPATGVWTLRLHVLGAPWFTSLQYASPGDQPVVGDWDGNGTSDLGLWRPSTGVLFKRMSLSARTAPTRIVRVPVGQPRH